MIVSEASRSPFEITLHLSTTETDVFSDPQQTPAPCGPQPGAPGGTATEPGTATTAAAAAAMLFPHGGGANLCGRAPLSLRPPGLVATPLSPQLVS